MVTARRKIRSRRVPSSVWRSSRRVRPVKSASSARRDQRSRRLCVTSHRSRAHIAGLRLRAPIEFLKARLHHFVRNRLAERRDPIRRQSPVIVVAGAILPLVDFGVGDAPAGEKMNRVDDRLVKRSVHVHQNAIHIKNDEFGRELHRIPSMARSTLARVGPRAGADAHKTFARKIFPLAHQNSLSFQRAHQAARCRAEIREHEIRAARINSRAQTHESLFQQRAALQNFPRVVAQQIACRRSPLPRPPARPYSPDTACTRGASPRGSRASRTGSPRATPQAPRTLKTCARPADWDTGESTEESSARKNRNRLHRPAPACAKRRAKSGANPSC